MHGQQSTEPNIQHCILDLIMTLSELIPVANREQEGGDNELCLWVRCQILGMSQKCLRVFEIPHFAGCLLNPGVGYIPDINNFLPWQTEWFSKGISKENFRTMHACVKNANNRYRPT